jgi:thiamine biosynthesis lipoprotein
MELIERRERIMGCAASFHVAVEAPQVAAAEAALNAAVNWLRVAEATLTRFDPASELSRLNRAADTWFSPSALLWDVLHLALVAAETTDGLFDPALLPQMEAIGYDRDFALIAQRAADGAPGDLPPGGGWRGIECDIVNRRVRLPQGVALDLGGIAKGWAADYVVEQILADFPNALVSLGGDLRLRGGPQPGELWAVGVHDPMLSAPDGTARLSATLTLGSGGVATSGATGQWWHQGDTVRHHLIDPRTGAPAHVWVAHNLIATSQGDPANLVAMVTALAPTAAAAEVATKVALLRGPAALLLSPAPCAEGAGEWGHAALLMITGDGILHWSTNCENYLSQHGGGNLWRWS